MRSFTALFVVLLATCASASFTVSLNKVHRVGSSAVANRDLAVSLESHTAANGSNTVPATNWARGQSYYTTSVGIGSPPTYYDLVIDTGSSLTWCGGNKPYNRTSTSIPTGQSLSLNYGSGDTTALEYSDQVTLTHTLVINNQSIGALTTSAGFLGLDGIIGFGPVDLTADDGTNASIPTIMNDLVSQGLIKDQVLGVYFAPYSGNESDTNGALTYGGTDPSLYLGEVTYVPLANTYPVSRFWGINVTSVTYGNYTIISESTAGIVDSGSTQVLLAHNFFQTYMNAIPGAVFNSTIRVIQIPTSAIPFMHPLDFKIGDEVLTLDVPAQLIPQDQNTAWGGDPDLQYGVVGDSDYYGIGSLNFILGQAFMERYYTVFDADNKRVGFATTNNTFNQTLF